MNTTLKIIGSSPIYSNLEGELWNVFLRANPNYEANVHDLTVNGKNYLFEIKDCRVVKDKWVIMGWLSNDETVGKIIFEQQ